MSYIDSSQQGISDEQFYAAINAYLPYKGFFDDLVQRLTDWHSIDREAFVELLCETERAFLANEESHPDWITSAVKGYWK